MDEIEVRFRRLVKWAKVPEYDTKKAAGCDMEIALQEEIILYPQEVASIPTGFAIKIPPGYEAQIRSRAGMARKGIVVANAPATLDAEHTGEVHVLLTNITSRPIKVLPGQKVAQMIFCPIVKANFNIEE